ncbi:MarR family winged helix-turn-helix transcriptional regulator [Sulfolobus acidocaldarius]|uniref:HTH-type transcriptional regulator MgrA n=5 Tax=Sulfolobus acidocaldarius TaxID=2285 RepID=Q4J726_SULAC|nr:MarR family transcriptional regulator [Sulfolobus acidocaldarius]AAY81406.1 transcriptional regulator MarR family [Sulfolobus acidocaldarius DSM 639]AGE72005.1 MarR family transcriptional regulator [Sulfolobus acidocaldarius N8]AGE74321.1 MarR family transcriptional regulator [Sulfolobus acidocaldarius Ron12/I]ALU30612.1 MarR family transcriptional regulator [Sulfolobus acidocaldarius]ALU32874.1 MarR family transcriptional regulator [Sulfolobus acidocaldarius]
MEITMDERLQVIVTIAKVNRAFQRELNKKLAKLNISYLDYLVLRGIKDGPKPMVELANKYLVTQASITSTVDKLEDMGLVRRERSQDDRRLVLIYITEKGKGVMEEGFRIYRELSEEIMKELKDDQVKSLLEGLNILLSRLENIKS